MLSYELCKNLKDAGFPLRMMSMEDAKHSKLKHEGFIYGKDSMGRDNTYWFIPTLSELIESVKDGRGYFQLEFLSSRTMVGEKVWGANVCLLDGHNEVLKWAHGNTPEEAVAQLFLTLANKS